MLNKQHNSIITLALLLTLVGTGTPKPARASLLAQVNSASTSFADSDNNIATDAIYAQNIPSNDSTSSDARENKTSKKWLWWLLLLLPLIPLAWWLFGRSSKSDQEPAVDNFPEPPTGTVTNSPIPPEPDSSISSLDTQANNRVNEVSSSGTNATSKISGTTLAAGAALAGGAAAASGLVNRTQEDTDTEETFNFTEQTNDNLNENLDSTTINRENNNLVDVGDPVIETSENPTGDFSESTTLPSTEVTDNLDDTPSNLIERNSETESGAWSGDAAIAGGAVAATNFLDDREFSTENDLSDGERQNPEAAIVEERVDTSADSFEESSVVNFTEQPTKLQTTELSEDISDTVTSTEDEVSNFVEDIETTTSVSHQQSFNTVDDIENDSVSEIEVEEFNFEDTESEAGERQTSAVIEESTEEFNFEDTESEAGERQTSAVIEESTEEFTFDLVDEENAQNKTEQIPESITDDISDGEDNLINEVTELSENTSNNITNSFDPASPITGAAIGGAAPATSSFLSSESEAVDDLDELPTNLVSDSFANSEQISNFNTNLDEITLDKENLREQTSNDLDISLDELTFDDSDNLDISLDELTFDDSDNLDISLDELIFDDSDDSDISLDELTFDDSDDLAASLDEIALDDSDNLDEIKFDDSDDLVASLDEIALDESSDSNLDLDKIVLNDSTENKATELTNILEEKFGNLSEEKTSSESNDISEWLENLETSTNQSNDISEWLNNLDTTNVIETKSSDNNDLKISENDNNDDISFQFLEDLLEQDSSRDKDNK